MSVRLYKIMQTITDQAWATKFKFWAGSGRKKTTRADLYTQRVEKSLWISIGKL